MIIVWQTENSLYQYDEDTHVMERVSSDRPILGGRAEAWLVKEVPHFHVGMPMRFAGWPGDVRTYDSGRSAFSAWCARGEEKIVTSRIIRAWATTRTLLGIRSN